MNTTARAWSAAITAIKEARDLRERGGSPEVIRDLLQHAHEMIDVMEEELAEGRAATADHDFVRMAAAELRTRLNAAEATLVPLH